MNEWGAVNHCGMLNVIYMASILVAFVCSPLERIFLWLASPLWVKSLFKGLWEVNFTNIARQRSNKILYKEPAPKHQIFKAGAAAARVPGLGTSKNLLTGAMPGTRPKSNLGSFGPNFFKHYHKLGKKLATSFLKFHISFWKIEIGPQNYWTGHPSSESPGVAGPCEW